MAEAEGLSFVDFADTVLGGEIVYTPAQRTFARVAFDLVDPCRLDGEEREVARVLFGAEVETVPPLARRVVEGVFGRGSGKDQIGGDYGLWRMLTADVSRAGPGDVPTFIVVAPDMRLSGITRARSRERVRATPQIERLVESEGADGFTLRRPHDGRLVAFEVLPATRAGSSARGRSVLGALLSECAFFRDEGAAVNDQAVYSAILPRLMAGGAILLFSTPWAEIGIFFELYEKNYRKPSTALVAQASTSVMRPNDPQVAELVALETERDALNAERELGAQFIGIGSSSYFDAASIDAAVDPEMVFPLPPDPKHGRAVAADLGFKLDASALVIIQNTPQGALTAFVDEVRPTLGAPLVPSDVYLRFARSIMRYHGGHVHLDQHYIESAREYFLKNGIDVLAVPGGKPGKVAMHLGAKELLAEGKVRLPKHPRLIAQLKSIVGKPLAGGGTQIITPRRAGQYHGDIASAWVSAAWAVHRAGVTAPGRARHQAQTRRIVEGLNLLENGSERDWQVHEARLAAKAQQRMQAATGSSLGSEAWREQADREWEATLKRGGFRQ